MHPGTEEQSRHTSCSLLSDSRRTLAVSAQAACSNERALTPVVLAQYKLCPLSALSKQLFFSQISASYWALTFLSLTLPASHTVREPTLLLFRQCGLFMSLLPDLALFSSCIPIKCRTFVLLRTTVLSGTKVS